MGDTVSTLDDEFGHVPGRPTHPDMARLSAIIRHNDALSERPLFQMALFVAQYADPETVFYIAKQRALRAEAAMEAQDREVDLGQGLMAMWLDGLMLGLAASGRELPRDGQRRQR